MDNVLDILETDITQEQNQQLEVEVQLMRLNKQYLVLVDSRL